MKRLIKALLVGMGVFSAFYLAGSFGNASFNIATWDELSRGMIAGFGLIVTIIGTVFCYGYLGED